MGLDYLEVEGQGMLNQSWAGAVAGTVRKDGREILY